MMKQDNSQNKNQLENSADAEEREEQARARKQVDPLPESFRERHDGPGGE